mgnify:CR=1 FL=1
MNANASTRQESTASESLEGLYPINATYEEGSIYPSDAEVVYIKEVQPDAYRKIVMFDGDGKVIFRHERSEERIRSALAGEYGFDAFLSL